MRVRNFDISFRNESISSSYQISAPPISSLFNSAEFKNETTEKIGNDNKKAKDCVLTYFICEYTLL